jgi:hypothetical protein
VNPFRVGSKRFVIYRPIALLPIVRKVIEALVARRVTEATEAYGLLLAK